MHGETRSGPRSGLGGPGGAALTGCVGGSGPTASAATDEPAATDAPPSTADGALAGELSASVDSVAGRTAAVPRACDPTTMADGRRGVDAGVVVTGEVVTGGAGTVTAAPDGRP